MDPDQRVKRARRVVVVCSAAAAAFLAGLALLPSAAPMAADAGAAGHYVGQQSLATWRGVTANIEIGSPDVLYNTSGSAGFVAQRIIVKSAEGAAQEWLEFGPATC